MDKLKPALDFMKKFGFWFLLGLTVIVVLGCWWMATNSVAKEIKEKKATIEKNFTDVSAIANATSHPNQAYLQSLEAEQNKLKDKVLTAWKTLYDQQQEKNPWPKVLGDEFLDTIKNLKPNEEIPNKMRVRYMTFIQDYFPTLLKEVDYRHPKGDDGLGGNVAKRDESIPLEIEGVVDWDINDIKRLKNKLEWQTPPSDIKLRLTQEDLWVTLALLRVIKNTNENITEHSKAAIKHIDSIDIGAAAVVAWRLAEGKVFRGSEAAGGAAAGATGAPGGGPVAAAGATLSEKELLMLDRYVDDKGNPLTGDPSAAFAEFKMMPIRMKLYIDQRKIAKLLVECANSAMPIEVRRVRIKPDEGEVVDFGTGGATGGGETRLGPPMGGPGMMPGGAPGYGPPPGYGGPGGRGLVGPPPGYGGFGGPGMARGGGGQPMGGGGVAGPFTGAGVAWDKSPMDIPVEIQGIICIYNPPNKDKLGTGTMGQTPAAGETPPGTTPEATPTTPTAAAPATPAPGDATTPQATPAPAATQPATQPGAQPQTAPATPAATPAATPPATPPAEPAKADK